MKHLALILICLSGTLFCFGQTTYQLDKDTSKYKNSPNYILIHHKKADTIFSASFINPKSIDSIKILRLYNADHHLQNSTILIKLKDNIEILSLNQLLDKYHITLKDRKLPIFIDSAIAYRPETIRLELGAVKSVKIEIEKITDMEYISILSLYPVTRPKKGEIYIKGVEGKTK